MIGLYVPGNSLVHRTPPGLKLLLLLVAGVGIVLVREPWQLAAALAVVLAAYVCARLSLVVMLQQIRPLWLLLLVILALHVIITGWSRALVVVGSIMCLVLLAALVTLTTRISELVDVVERAAAPLRRTGVDPARLGLAMALGIRCVPMVVALAAQIRDAQRARRARPQLRGFATAFVVRSLRRADALTEALIARGVDD